MLVGLGLAVASEWMFAPELKSGAVQAVLQEWSLPAVDLWAVFPTGRQANAKDRAFVSFMETQLLALSVVPGDELIGNVTQVIADDLWLRANPQNIVTGPFDQRCFPAGCHRAKGIPCMARDHTK